MPPQDHDGWFHIRIAAFFKSRINCRSSHRRNRWRPLTLKTHRDAEITPSAVVKTTDLPDTLRDLL